MVNWTVPEASGFLQVGPAHFRRYSIASAHQHSWRPDWTNTDEVPSFTNRTIRSALPCVSDQCGVDHSWFQFSSSQRSRIFFWAQKCSKTSHRCRTRDVRACGYFAIRVFGENEWLSCAFQLFCLKLVGFGGGCARGGSAGGGISTSAGETDVELDDLPVNPSVNGWSHSGNSVSTCKSWSNTARVCFRSPRARVWWSAACTPETTKWGFGCRCCAQFVSHSLIFDGWPGCLSYEPFLLAQLSQRVYHGWFFKKKNWTSTNMSKPYTQTVASSVVCVVPFAASK